jgi:hypothetical protein
VADIVKSKETAIATLGVMARLHPSERDGYGTLLSPREERIATGPALRPQGRQAKISPLIRKAPKDSSPRPDPIQTKKSPQPLTPKGWRDHTASKRNPKISRGVILEGATTTVIQKMNPASRLHRLLDEFRGMPKNITLRHAISQVFAIDDPWSPEVFKAYVSVINLSLEVEERLQAIPDLNVGLYKRAIDSITKHISVSNIDGELNSFKQGLKNEDLYGLEFISDQFDKIEREEPIAEEELKKLEKQLDRLIDEVRKSGVSPEFIHFLVSHLFMIRTSVQNYRFFGGVGIKASMARVIGELMLDRRGVTTDEQKKSVVRKIIDAIKDANALIQILRSGTEVANALPLDEILRING